MPLSRKLSASILLDDGRTIATLREAVDFALRLPEAHRRNFHWQYAAQAIQAAAELRASRDELDEAERRLIAALKAEGALGLRTREGAPRRGRRPA